MLISYLLLERCLTTSLPTLPEAPVIRIVSAIFLSIYEICLMKIAPCAVPAKCYILTCYVNKRPKNRPRKNKKRQQITLHEDGDEKRFPLIKRTSKCCLIGDHLPILAL